jgi:general secretion pathway protein I
LKHRCPLRKTGFTLLEIMVALSIIALVLVSVYQLQMQSLSAEQASRFYITAPLLAQKKIAELETQSLDRLTDRSGDFGDAFPGYTWQVNISTVDAEMLDKLSDQFKKIEVAVFFNQDENRYSLQTCRFFEEALR